MIAHVQTVALLAAAAAAAAAAHVSAYPSFREHVPNGITIGKSLGHSDAGGFTEFGILFLENNYEWSAVCSQTWPDGSVTVGSALGDPCCTWKKGGTPDFAISSMPAADTKGTTCASTPTPTPTPTTSSAAAAATTTDDEYVDDEYCE